MRLNRSNITITFLDVVTAPDIAYTISVYENATKSVERRKLQIRASSTTDDERH